MKITVCGTVAMRWKFCQNQGALSRLLQLLQPYLPQRSH